MSTFASANSLCLNYPCRIVNDPIKGRCLEIEKSFSAGDVLWTEEAIVFGSYNERSYDCDTQLIQSALAHNSENLEEIDEIVLALADLDQVQSEDIALCFLQLLAIYKKKKDNNILLTQSMHDKIHLMSQLSASNHTKCISNISEFRRTSPSVIHPDITDTEAGYILGILNTNQIELNDVGGTGLFVYTAILEHNCQPNCSFVTAGNTLYLTALTSLHKNDRLSIDYGNYYYHCTNIRREGLLKSYDFLCNCRRCQSSDTTRAFLCELCSTQTTASTTSSTSLNDLIDVHSSQARVYPPAPASPAVSSLHVGTHPEEERQTETEMELELASRPWHCSRCEVMVSEARKILLLDTEKQVIAHPPTILDELLSVMSMGVLHITHYLVYWSLKDISDCLVEEANLIRTNEAYDLALQSCQMVLTLLERCVPQPHHEKVVLYDQFAQLAVACNRIDIARTSYQTAYEISCRVCGSDVPCSKDLYHLTSNTPSSIAELQEHYDVKHRASIL
mmetsp:Transcript_14763/g.14863  ORF Transcript_14763/g.14863 Transcript_14763/m.14863 type:complete len:506 (-) Transcript_14763:229-1746(-)